jgi:hypothetical protein
MKLDGYIRVSRVGGRSGDSFISPDLQRQQIARHAQLHGHEVIAWHRRGTTDYVVRPIPWPGEGAHDAFLASIPEWAWRNGHPAIPEDVRAEVHELALQHGQAQFLPDDAEAA